MSLNYIKFKYLIIFILILFGVIYFYGNKKNMQLGEKLIKKYGDKIKLKFIDNHKITIPGEKEKLLNKITFRVTSLRGINKKVVVRVNIVYKNIEEIKYYKFRFKPAMGWKFRFGTSKLFYYLTI